MAHIDSLPEELLSPIFHATFEEIKASSVSWEDVGTFPDLLNILLVCTHWNRVAVATPSLWTFIAIYGKGFEGVRKRVRRDLVRSKGCPLDVVVQVDYLFKSEELGTLDSLFEEIAQHGHRWQTLQFRHLTQRAIDVLGQHLPRLVSLSIIGSLRGRTLKLSTPLLQKYTAPWENSDRISFEDSLPIFTHLKHFLTPRTAPVVLQHLRCSQRTLTALTLTCYAERSGTQFRIHLENGAEFIVENLNLSLPTLTEYTVRFGAGSWGWNALRIAHMPHLRRLDIHWTTFQHSNPSNTVPFMPQLISLNIFTQYPFGLKDAAPPLAAATPNVKEVSLIQLYQGLPYEVEWLLPRIHPSQDSLTVAWPRLVVLRLCGMVILECDELRGIALGRPAFKHLSVDSTCLQISKQAGQDLYALREYFDVVATDQQGPFSAAGI